MVGGYQIVGAIHIWNGILEFSGKVFWANELYFDSELLLNFKASLNSSIAILPEIVKDMYGVYTQDISFMIYELKLFPVEHTFSNSLDSYQIDTWYSISGTRN